MCYDDLTGFFNACLVLGAVRVERLEVEPRGHVRAAVEGDGHLLSVGTDYLHVGRSFRGESGSPGVTGISKAVEEDDSGGVGGLGGDGGGGGQGDGRGESRGGG